MRYCGKPLDRAHGPSTCRRNPGHGGICGPVMDRGPDEEFNNAWAEYFAAHPEVLADWAHQNYRMPPGYGEEREEAGRG